MTLRDAIPQTGEQDASSERAVVPSGANSTPRHSHRVARGPDLAQLYRRVRAQTETLCAPLSAEDCMLQSMPDASPAKWHLAHTSWFFEEFVLKFAATGYAPPDPEYGYLFNSYYEAVGPRHARPKRGLLSRPSLEQVYDYRHRVDEGVLALLQSGEGRQAAAERIELGLHHEQQHQELIVTDIKHGLYQNRLAPAYVLECRSVRMSGDARLEAQPSASPLRFVTCADGEVFIGHEGRGFAYDNELPRHRFTLAPHALGSRLVTCREYLEFIEDGGYRRPELWLSDGFATVNEHGWSVPLYWDRGEEGWQQFSLSGRRPLDLDAPVCHVSYYEADAYATWFGARLATEQEWEARAGTEPVQGNFLENGEFAPRPLRCEVGSDSVLQLFGDVWEWTRSSYAPYPGYRPASGALGEYNGKFMVNQMVLRGGSCATPKSHIRSSYRNFFHPASRWQFSGIRLARDSS